MTRVALFILIVCILTLTACAGASTTTPAPSGPTFATRTFVPLPAQPTSPRIATRAATPFASATFSSIVNVPPTAGAAGPSSVATAAGGPPAAAQPTVAGPSAPGVATGVRTEIKVEFVNALSTAEEVDDLRLTLVKVPGIMDVSGNENAIVIGYDAGLILPNQIRARLASLGHPIKP